MKRNYQQAIDFIKNGQWDAAHEIVQAGRDPTSCWIHAWLHRQEGDTANARYWYQMAGIEFPDIELTGELLIIEKSINAGEA